MQVLLLVMDHLLLMGMRFMQPCKIMMMMMMMKMEVMVMMKNDGSHLIKHLLCESLFYMIINCIC